MQHIVVRCSQDEKDIVIIYTPDQDNQALDKTEKLARKRVKQKRKRIRNRKRNRKQAKLIDTTKPRLN